MRNVLSVLTLLVLWLLMSGIYKPLVIGFGVAAAIISVYVVRRMDKTDEYPIAFQINPLKFIGYLGWLMLEIAKSNIAVTRLILSPTLKLRQNIFRVPNTQRTDLAEVIFASSITLTPGTITVETGHELFWVHAANYDPSDHDALSEMDARVSRVEWSRPKGSV